MNWNRRARSISTSASASAFVGALELDAHALPGTGCVEVKIMTITRSFSYDAFYNADESRIETHLRSLKDQQVRIAGHLVEFVAGEAIHIGSSYKYVIEEFGCVARDAGFLTVKAWTDRDSLYSVHYLRPID